ILAGYGFTLGGAAEGYAFYLEPDTSTLLGDAIGLLPDAAGQAFFTLSLGMGVMVTYASYLGEDRNLLSDSLLILVVDTFIALLAGLAIFPTLFSGGGDELVDPAEGGPGIVFIGLGEAFAELPAGEIIGAVFYIALFMAALTSAFSILEVIVAYVTETFDIERKPATLIVSVIIFLVGVPTALDTDVFTAYDVLANQVLLITGGLLLAIFVGWAYTDGAVDEFTKGMGGENAISTLWIWLLRIPIVLILLYVLYNGVLATTEAVGALL
ncbi:MAG: sodium-dependent transporter, partial [Natrialbaceae archaeon]